MKPTSPSTPHPEFVEGALVVALARPAEPVLEQIVGLKLREDARSLPLPIAQDPGNRPSLPTSLRHRPPLELL